MEDLFKGNYLADIYEFVILINYLDVIFVDLVEFVFFDFLYDYFVELSSFENCNIGVDIMSVIFGMGVVCCWVYSKFENFLVVQEGWFEVGYFQFD